MAYVVARPKGRFEIRESVHTDKGPRARTLASFKELTNEVLARARRRASRPFDTKAVRASAERAEHTIVPAGARATASTTSAPARSRAPRHRQPESRFVESSRRMARALAARPPRAGVRRDPGDALIDLLGLVAQVSAFGPRRSPEPLRFPPLARLRTARATASSAR
jgi:hypothetical protein